MHKLKILLILFINSIFFLVISGQENQLQRNIQWKEKQVFFQPKTLEEISSEKYILVFSGAVYENEKHHLPIYNELLRLNGNNGVIIEEKKFAVLSGEELKSILDLNKIGHEIIVDTKMVIIRKESFLNLKFIPLRKNRVTGQYEKLVHFKIKLVSKKSKGISKKGVKAFSNRSILSTGNWIKIKIDNSGVYKITYDELRDLGINNPENVRVFGNGGEMLPFYNNVTRYDDLYENKILKTSDAIYFYGDGPVQWSFDEAAGIFRHQKHLYSKYTYYFLSSSSESVTNNTIQTENQSALATTHTINSFTDFAYHETDSINLILSGRLWVGEHFDFQRTYNYTFDFQNLVNGSSIILESSLIVRSPITSFFSINLNGSITPSSFSAVNYNYTSTFANHKIERFSSTASSSNEIAVGLSYENGTASSEAWLDYIVVNANRLLSLSSAQLQFRNTQSVGIGNIGQFNIANTTNTTQIWDITNPQSPTIINASNTGNTLSFRIATDSLREFVAFNESNTLSPITSGDYLGVIENQNLHGISQADMVIVSHPEFIEHANELKEIHESKDNLNIRLVTSNQVYNEFSSGAPDVSAIRDFMKMLYDRAGSEQELPKYLCLFGDGSYDNKKVNAENTNFILTYQSKNSLSPTQSFVTDDFYGLLDDDEGGHEGFLDIGIGRIPVKTKTEAANAIKKIRDYLSIDAYGDWRNRSCFIADDEDNNIHISQANELSQKVKDNYPVFNVEKVFIDAFEQESSSGGQRYPDANLAIDNLISKGLLLINYTGHGNENGLAEERIITIDQINKWHNANKLPVFMTATCEFSRFDDYRRVSAGEQVFLNPNGGAISLFTTTRLVYASPNFELNKNFYDYVFEINPLTNKQYCLGDIMRLTKNASGSGINKRNFTLLGDPALQLSYAQMSVKTNLINGSAAGGAADTIKAFEKVTISGEIQNKSGAKLSQYNGILYPGVYDKNVDVRTLNNDGEGVFNYQIRNSQIFKGKASITNGNFSFSFIVPKDIKYNVDTGKVSYYSSNNQLLEDSKGYFKNVLIGGSSQGQITDNEGPKISLYLNDENFVSGGITNETPQLLAFLSDENGINTTGNGIGHDIIATIDNQANLQFNLNEFYESNIDDYTSGELKYSFPELEPGEHQLHFKVWDVYNNSSEDSILFVVADSENFNISHVLNYPNPFSTNTSFFFEHNRPNEPLEVIIHIFTVSGKVIKTIHTDLITSGFRSEGIPWNGRDDFGNKIGRGVYFYKLSVRTSQAEKADKIEKLLILN